MASPSSAQPASIFVVDWMNKTWCLVIVIAAALLASPLSSAAQETRTQQVQLEEGWNLVSFNVHPDDASFASIFGANAEQIAMVKNEDGEVYAPDEGIEQITTWKAGEGYQIHAEAPTTLEVTGTAVRPGSTSIVLKEGGNIVPYLPASVQAVTPALTSVQKSLVVVEEERGARYAPSASSPALDSLRPGQAYKVYVDRADTLRYPIVVSDLAEAKRLEGVEVGATVRIWGYAEPGDGGGGTFEVTDSGGETDGGTVFVFNEDLSAEQSLSFNTTGLEGETLPNSDIVWGTVDVQLGQSSGQPSIGNERLHGHHKVLDNDIFPLLDYSTGTFQGTGNRLKSARENENGTGFIVRYKHATSARRLERKGVYNSVNIDWWGAPKADPQNPENARVPIVWAINKAAKLYQNKSLDWAYVDIPGEYYYRYRTLIREGVKLRGASDVTFGNASNGEPTYGKLTIMPGLALNHLKSSWSGTLNEAFRINRDLAPANKVSRVGIERLEVDGNIDGNLKVFQNMSEYGGEDNIETKLQNGNHWNGFFAIGKQATVPTEGAIANFSNTYLHDFPGNGIAQEAQFDFSGTENLRVGDAPRNHSLYDPRGTYEGLTLDASSWFAIVKITKENVSFKNLKVNPKPNELDQYLSESIQTRHILTHGGKKTPLNWLDESAERKKWEIDVDEFEFNIGSDNNRGMNLKISGYGGSIKNGVVKTHPATGKSFGLFRTNSTSNNGPIRGYSFENITVKDRSGGFYLLGGKEEHTHNTFKNITVESQVSESDGQKLISGIERGSPSEFAEYDETVSGNSVPLPMAARLDLKNVDLQRSRSGPILRGDDSGSHPYNVFADNFSVDNDGGTPGVYSTKSHGIVHRIPPSEDAIRVFLSNSTFNVYAVPFPVRSFRSHRALAQGNKPLRIRNCQDRQGRTSDIVSQTYTSDASDEGNDYVLIPTSLMSYPNAKSATVTSGARSVSSVEVSSGDPTPPFDRDDVPMDPTLRVNLDAAIQAGNTITIEYTARVTPLEDYRTTGLFVAREVTDKAYASGNGPWQIDLRGVAASQESKEPIEYSATSSNTSVVTTSMQTTTGTDGNDHTYLLDLTEQGTGTATVTVTGSIDGVGTTTDTFEVSIE